MAWWRDAVVLQIYPRSYSDSNGDGDGDLRGIAARVDHIAALGVDAVWLSPIFPSPMADGGYDVADLTGVDPRFGTLADVDHLVAVLHARDIRLLLDVVPCHTSIEHPWFRDHPERYVWSPVDGPPNNWIATFGGSAWSPDPHGRGWYLHSFYPEQPDLDWRHPDVPVAVGDALGFWLARGVDGFRLDAIDRLRKDPQLRDEAPATGDFPLPLEGEYGTQEHRWSVDAPDIGESVAQLRAAAPDAFLVGEVYLPADRQGPYQEHLDACFSFELLFAEWDAPAIRAAITTALAHGTPAWVLSNHDFPRLPDRVGAENARAAAMLLLALPGPVFVFQGDELGLANGPGNAPREPHDRFGRDPYRHPMPWGDGPHHDFTAGTPWLPVVAPPDGPAATQAGDPDSMLAFQRRLIAVRRELRGPLNWLEAGPDVVAFSRGRHAVAVRFGDDAGAPVLDGDVLAQAPGAVLVRRP